jgi:N,N'-diacetyllegionaminate synthase
LVVRSIRNVEAALGDGIKRPVAEEANTAAVARRSLVAARNIDAGTILTEDLVAIVRPGTGLSPTMRSQLVGRRTRRDIEAGTLLTLDMVA